MEIIRKKYIMSVEMKHGDNSKVRDLQFLLGIVAIGLPHPTNIEINWKKRDWTPIGILRNGYLLTLDDFKVEDLLPLGIAQIHIKCGRNFQTNITFTKQNFVDGYACSGSMDDHGLEFLVFMGVRSNPTFKSRLQTCLTSNKT